MNEQRINDVVGWLVFAVATAVYTLTLEPTTSFWDCGEFISACYKLQIMHPPGAPFFMLTGRLFTLLAGNPENVAWSVNFLSGLTSAFTILFLFWTITALGRKMFEKAPVWLLMGAGAVGALAYTFSDSFWFSAVEGEVYAFSSFFTAVVFWAILKWDRVADEPYSDRWLIFIAYLMGLSIGVHLLNLLAIPAICLVVYLRRQVPTLMGVVVSLLVAVGVLAFVQYGIIPGIPTLASKFELLLVNSLGMPFGTGNWLFGLVVVVGMAWGIWFTHQRKLVLWNQLLLGTAFVVIGYSSYSMIVIRSLSNPSINMNKPSDIFTLISYINREQYGDRPLLTGPYFTAEVVDQEEGPMKYRKGQTRYEESGRDIVPIYDPEQQTFLPRAYKRAGTQQRHIDFYKSWLDLRDGEKPRFSDNMNFLFTYQLGHMYMRYFLWNFVGRQNDIQGQGMDIEKGNWISGIEFLDKSRVGPSEKLSPSRKNNRARNTYFGLPLLLGLLGLWYHFKKAKGDAWTVFLLFLLTGIAIVIYLNFEPLQPRERDYAYVGSFYAFAIWIGLGVLALYDRLSARMNQNIAIALSVGLGLIVPGIMGAQNWDDHDRSGKYTARDVAINYLESCPANAILFTMGDNDTYPLWYAQEVEGIRTDVRVVNLSLLGTDWYIDHLRRSINQSEAIPLSIPQAKITMGTRDYVPFYDRKLNGYYDLKQLVDFMSSDDNAAKLPTQSGTMINYFPTQNFSMPVDFKAALAQGAVSLADSARIPSKIEWTFARTGLMKNDLIIMDLLAQNKWKRPVCWTVSMGSEQYLGLEDYFRLEGLVYRLTPFKVPASQGMPSQVATDHMFRNITEKFRWGRMKEEIYIDPETNRMTINLRSNCMRLVERLLLEGRNADAIKVLDLCDTEMPNFKITYLPYNYQLVEFYHRAGAPAKANQLAEKLFDTFESEAVYFNSLRGKQRTFYERDEQAAKAVMSEMIRLSKDFKQTKLAEKFQQRAKAFGV
jgi:hypothetical protein